MKRFLLPLLPVLLAACQSTVTRSESMAIAKAYCEHVWTPTDANVFHGRDDAGIEVHTPDKDFREPGIRPGWWVSNSPNTGIPYQWGGFDSLESFDAKIATGFAAGDVYTREKRKALDAAVSKRACGIDCSGFVSRCWKLPRAYSTRELASLCDPLASYDDLRPGDILNKENDHVLLFAGFRDDRKKRFYAYETGCPPTWKTVCHHIETSRVRNEGYLPYRYRGMRE